MLEQDLTKTELIAKLQDIEWEDFEVKEAKNEVPKSSWESVSAFSNTAGGWLIFGVNKAGRGYSVLGVNDAERVSLDFLNALRSGKLNKRIDPVAKKYEFGQKTVLAFYVPPKHAREKPIYFDNPKNTFIRTGSGDRRATHEEIDSFYRNASFEEKSEELTLLGFDSLDPETIAQYRTFFAQINPSHRYISLPDMDFLEKLSVIKNGRVTYGGLLAFGKDETLQSQLPNFRTEYLEIGGTSYENAQTKYDYRISSESNLFQAFFLIYGRLLKQIDIPFSVKHGIRNDDPPHLQALREALVNLIIHTDYFSRTNSRIRVFSDRYEFYNPGALPKRLELILKEDFSLPRNPIVAKIFRYTKFSENIGSGFNKMLNGWKAKYGLLPVIEGDFDYYKITFPKKKMSTTTNTTTKLMIRTATKASREPKEKEILGIISNNPLLSVGQISPLAGLTTDGVRYHIKNLKKKGILKRKGHGRGGSWEVLK